MLFCLLSINIYSQQDLMPAFPDEITYQGDRAYFNGSPFTGILVDKNSNAKLGEFRDGLKNGMFTEYYSKGKKKSEGNFINGMKEGKHLEWFENKILKSESNYSNGKKNGLFTEWFSNGNKAFEGNFSDDKENRTHIYWYENGAKKSEQEFMNNEPNGKLLIWYENGQLTKELYYEYGKVKNGNYTTYLETGLKDKEEYFENGRKINEGIYRGEDLFVYLTEYYPTGEKKTEGETKNGIKQGIWIEWYINGNKKREIKFNDGVIAEVLFENKNDPAFSIKKIRKPGSYILREINHLKKDTTYIMVLLNFEIKSNTNTTNSEITNRLKSEFLFCLGNFNIMADEQILNNLDKAISYHVELSNMGYEIKRFNNSVFPGTYNYTGRIGINMKIKDIKNGRSILNDSFSGAKAYTYPFFKSDVDVLLALPSEICTDISNGIKKISNLNQ